MLGSDIVRCLTHDLAVENGAPLLAGQLVAEDIVCDAAKMYSLTLGGKSVVLTSSIVDHLQSIVSSRGFGWPDL